MYRLSYAEIMEGDSRESRAREQLVFDRAIELMQRAEVAGGNSTEAQEAIQYVQRLWMFFIENLGSAENDLPDSLKDNLVSIGRWAIAEADRIVADRKRSFSSLIDINTAIRNGLS